MNEQDLKKAADAAGKAFGDASQKANAEVQSWAGAVPVLKKVLIGLAAVAVVVAIAYAIG